MCNSPVRVLLFGILACFLSLQAIYVDFDRVMQPTRFTRTLEVNECRPLYTFFKKQYAAVSFSTVAPRELKIPRIIHQIWLGSAFPEKFKSLQASIQSLHPDWEYHLWTDETVRSLPLENRDLFDVAKNYGEKSDILRYELLYQYGGVYLDVDVACVKPLTILHHCFDLYVGLQPLDTNFVQLGIGVLGCRPGHWMMAEVIKNLRCANTFEKIIQRTGPYYFTKMFVWCNEHRGNHQTLDAALPATYFYPMGYTQLNVPQSEWLKPEAFTIHYWAGSWL
jgi:mannosyltransferase OCH1-like enzyme